MQGDSLQPIKCDLCDMNLGLLGVHHCIFHYVHARRGLENVSGLSPWPAFFLGFLDGHRFSFIHLGEERQYGVTFLVSLKNVTV